MIVPNTASSLLLFATTRIAARRADGSQSVGTAFFFNFKVDDDRQLPVLITNKHVVSDAQTGVFRVHESTRDEHDHVVPASNSIEVSMSNFDKQWIGHPGGADLCAMPFQPLREQAQAQGKEIFFATLDEGLLPTPEQATDLRALEEVVMVGYPVGLWDDVNNFPILRRGSTALHLATDFCGQPVGLVDIAAFPGSSGSPILILNEGSFATSKGMVIGNRVLLLGVLFAGPQFTADGRIEVINIPTTMPIARTNIPVHLGYYIKAIELQRLKEHMFSVLNISQAQVKT